MTTFEEQHRIREEERKRREEQGDLILKVVAGLAAGTHCLCIHHGGRTRVWIEKRS